MANENPAAGAAGGVASPKAPTVTKIFLVHPLTKDEVEVNPTEAEMVPYMAKGYVQKAVK
jgi:hypothetical protein